MGNIRSYNGQILSVNGQIAAHEDCCCGGGQFPCTSCGCDNNNGPAGYSIRVTDYDCCPSGGEICQDELIYASDCIYLGDYSCSGLGPFVLKCEDGSWNLYGTNGVWQVDFMTSFDCDTGGEFYDTGWYCPSTGEYCTIYFILTPL